jgi:hypothetical protein
LGLDHPLLGGFVRKEFLGGDLMSFWEGVLLASLIWGDRLFLRFFARHGLELFMRTDGTLC